MISLGLDGLLACVLPLLAWRALATNDVRETIVLFISLGLLSALAWARLDAPDIALVEAAVGAGVTGALLLTTLRAVGHEPPVSASHHASRIVVLVLAVVVAVGIGTAVVMLPATAGLGPDVRAAVPAAGVSYPVTAVLLDLRAYDTLLEVAVLFVAVLAVRSQASTAGAGVQDDPNRPLLAVLVRLLVPGIVLVAGYLLWRGASAPGGAFQAAAVLAGGGILAIVAGSIGAPDPHARWVRGLLALGPAVFLAVAMTPLIAGEYLLEYPPGWAGTSIFAIELALTVSIALVLVMFFPGPRRRSSEPAEERA